MDDQLIHDPRTKQQIKDAIYTFLYKPLRIQFSKRLDSIITRNCTYTGSTNKSFTYKGETYSDPLEVPPRKVTRLHTSLIPVMDEYLKDMRVLNSQELPYVLGFIGQVLNASNHLPDYLKVFPTSIHQPIEELILTCPCKANQLSEEHVELLQNKNQVAINLLKQRMVLNLIT